MDQQPGSSGLNALGGALNLTNERTALRTKELKVRSRAGSYGHFTGEAQYGVQIGDYSAILPAQGLRDGGWRFQSPANITRLYGDLGWRSDGAELHLIASGALSSFGVAAATPIQLLDQNFRSIFTTPQTTDNKMGPHSPERQIRAERQSGHCKAISTSVGFRARPRRRPNAANLERCSNSSSPEIHQIICACRTTGFLARTR